MLISLREIVDHKKRKSLFWSLLWKLLSFYFYSYCNQRWFIILANIGTKYPFVKLHGLQWTHVRFITNNSLNQNSYHLYQVNLARSNICYNNLSNHRFNQFVLLNQLAMLQQIQIHYYIFIFHDRFFSLSFIPLSLNFFRRNDGLSLSRVDELSLGKFIHHTIDSAVVYYILNRKDLYCSHTFHMWTRYLLIFKNRFQPY